MTVVLIVIIVVLAVALIALAAVHFDVRPRRGSNAPPNSGRRVVFPFVAHALSRRALDAALRLARAEDATLVPVFLARVPLDMPLDTALPRQGSQSIPLQEAIEQRASEFGVPVEARIERGRTYRHALRQVVANERYDRIVIAASAQGSPGFDPDDVAWLLGNAPGEIVVLRPDAEEQIGPPKLPPRRRSRARAVAGARNGASRGADGAKQDGGRRSPGRVQARLLRRAA
jgi:hypothetical protein